MDYPVEEYIKRAPLGAQALAVTTTGVDSLSDAMSALKTRIKFFTGRGLFCQRFDSAVSPAKSELGWILWYSTWKPRVKSPGVAITEIARSE
jgi:hypothetical protein